ncbi:MAG: VWA domain-containing protein, partial [Planctomycetota bacterium]
GRFPVSREQLFAYDVVIFGDVNVQSFSPSTLENLSAFVSEAGGGLIFVAGPQFNPLSYQNTTLASLLPIEIDGVTLPNPNESIPASFQPVLTLEGQKSTPIFRFDTDERKSQAVWRGLPGLYWLAAIPNVKPGATVFVEHPTRMGDGRHLPVITMQRFGAGKAIFHATDETWLWRRRVGDLYYGRYWIQAIRYLSRSRLLGQAKTAELKSDRLVYGRGETVTLRVRFFNDEETPGPDEAVKAIVERRGGSNQEVILTRVAQAPNVFEGQLRRATDGSYHAWIASPSFTDSPPATDFRVESPENELRIRGLDRQQLSDAAKLSRGQFYTLATASQLPEDVPRGRPVPIRSEDPIRIWNRWEVLLLFVALLTTEWLLRKRVRLV